mgnify:CR=1 FL=1
MKHHAGVPDSTGVPTDPVGYLVSLVGSMPRIFLAVFRPVLQTEGPLSIAVVVVTPEGNHTCTHVGPVLVRLHSWAGTTLPIEADAVRPREHGLHMGNNRIARVAQGIAVGSSLQPPALAFVQNPVVWVVV